MSATQKTRTIPLQTFVMVAFATAALTWSCVVWLGGQKLMAAVIAVMLVELFLACLAVLAVLFTARLSDAYLSLEERHPERSARPRQLWLWRPLWQPHVSCNTENKLPPVPLVPVDHWLTRVHHEMSPVEDVSDTVETLPFLSSHSSDRGRIPVVADGKTPQRRAA